MKILLRQEERAFLYELLERSCQGQVATRARALLLTDLGETDEKINEALHAGKTLASTVKKHYHEGGLTRALYLSAEEAALMVIAVKPPDNGSARWTLELLTERARIILGKRVCRSTLFLLLRLNSITPYGMRQNIKNATNHDKKHRSINVA